MVSCRTLKPAYFYSKGLASIMGFNLPLAFLQGHHDTAQALGTCTRVKSRDVFMDETKLWVLEWVGLQPPLLYSRGHATPSETRPLPWVV